MDIKYEIEPVFKIEFFKIQCINFKNKKVTYVDIICEDTVDEKIQKALRKKINIATQIMGEELRQWI